MTLEGIKNVEVKPLAQFSNVNIQFTFGQIISPKIADYDYVMIATQGSQRIVLGGRHEELVRFFNQAQNGLVLQ